MVSPSSPITVLPLVSATVACFARVKLAAGVALVGVSTVGLVVVGVVMLCASLSLGMLTRARAKTAGATGNVRFVVTDAEDLAFKDEVFDRVVATCVFCSVPDPVRGLREAARVLRPGGEVVLLEHVRPGGILGMLFDLLDPLMSRLMGPHINRRTLDNVRKAGLQLVEDRRVFSDWVKVVVARSEKGRKS